MGFHRPPAFPAFFPCNYIAIVLWPIQAYSPCLTALPRASWGGRCSAEKLMWFSFWVLSIFVLKEVQFDLLIFFYIGCDVCVKGRSSSTPLWNSGAYLTLFSKSLMWTNTSVSFIIHSLTYWSIILQFCSILQSTVCSSLYMTCLENTEHVHQIS